MRTLISNFYFRGFAERKSFVFDFYEEEAGGRSSGTGGGTVAGCENFRDDAGGDATGACFGEGAYKVANHVVEEADSGNAIDEDAFLLAPMGMMDGSDGGCALWLVGRWFGSPGDEVRVDGSERSEVVRAYDMSGCLLELIEVEREGTGPDVRSKHRRADAAGRMDAVLVGFADSTMASVEIGGGVIDGEDADARRESVVECSVEVSGGDGGFERKRRYLCDGVNSGVGTA